MTARPTGDDEAPGERRRVVAKACLVAAGIASLSAAALLIREGGFAGADITILEARNRTGGNLDAEGDPDAGYTMRGGRMFELHFECTYDLAPEDLVFVTNGSMTANSMLGSTDAAPVRDSSAPDASWLTVTTKDPTFFKAMEEFSGSEAGKGRADHLQGLPLAADHRPQPPAALPPAARRHLCVVGLRAVPRPDGRPCGQGDGRVHRPGDPDRGVRTPAARAERADHRVRDRAAGPDAVHHQPVPGPQGR
ncbi:hypothetical protein GCM10010343_33010 [Streptomyces avidinii]|uniref:NAD(P)-binding protein n=1 Tax=Streptomyces avidinii TaxID=1895 RepID=A0ABS4LGJ3_STRAV|nr:hypothetical protein [Streptomyces avidinii]GGZ04430.1 hypothetical protein GCM10010343_33010 [Streptomyces avidinii]